MLLVGVKAGGPWGGLLGLFLGVCLAVRDGLHVHALPRRPKWAAHDSRSRSAKNIRKSPRGYCSRYHRLDRFWSFSREPRDVTESSLLYIRRPTIPLLLSSVGRREQPLRLQSDVTSCRRDYFFCAIYYLPTFIYMKHIASLQPYLLTNYFSKWCKKQSKHIKCAYLCHTKSPNLKQSEIL